MDNSTKEDIRVLMKMMIDSNEILNDLPFRIWIEIRNHEENKPPFLQVEYIKNKIKPIKKLQPIEAENMFTLSVDNNNPQILSPVKLTYLSQEDLKRLKEWTKSNFEGLMELWNGKRKVILGYPLKL